MARSDGSEIRSLAPSERTALEDALLAIYGSVSGLDTLLVHLGRVGGPPSVRYAFNSSDPAPVAISQLVEFLLIQGELDILADLVRMAAARRHDLINTVERVLREATARNHEDLGPDLPHTLMFCHIRPPAPDQSEGADLGPAHQFLFGLADQIGGYSEIRQEADGFLVTYTSPIFATRTALALQGAGMPEARFAIGLYQATFPANMAIQPFDRSFRSVRAIAQLALDRQVLMSAAVLSSVAGANFMLPEDVEVRQANHQVYALASGDRVEICEIARSDVRRPEAPANTSSAASIENMLQLAGFDSLKRQASGPNALVYRGTLAEDGVPRDVAIKLLAHLGASEEQKSAFVETAGKLQELPDHPAIIKVLGVNRGALPYFVMDWVEGVDFATTMASIPDFHERLNLAIAVCDGIAYAHAAGIFHGDLKPSNIIVRHGERQPVVLDFGQEDWIQPNTAHLSYDAGGTALYVAPELISSGGTTPRALNGMRRATDKSDAASLASADIYSLGAIFYQVFVGRPPFDFNSRQAVLTAHLTADPELPTLVRTGFSVDLEAVILRAMEKDPAARYRSASELCEALRAVRNGIRISDRPRLYNNAMETPANVVMDRVEHWKAGDLITTLEYGRLRRALLPLLRQGLSAVGESRLMHPHIVALYMAGATLITGMSIFLIFHSRAQLAGSIERILIGLSVLAITAGLWFVLRGRGRYRAAFALSILAVASMPLATTNIVNVLTPSTFDYALSINCEPPLFGVVHSSCVSYSELVLADTDEQNATWSTIYANWQLWIGVALTLVWATYVCMRTHTITMATFSAVLLGLLYLASLDFVGLRFLWDRQDLLGLYLMPFALVAIVFSRLLIRLAYPRQAQPRGIAGRAARRERRRLVVPFETLSVLVFIVSMTLISLNIGDIRDITGEFYIDVSIMFFLSGVIFYFGSYVFVFSRSSDTNAVRWILIFVGSFYAFVGPLLIGDYLLDGTFPEWWPALRLPDEQGGIGLGALVALIVAIVVMADSTRLNSRPVLALGAAQLAISLWYPEFRMRNFEPNFEPTWSYLIMLIGALALGAISYVLLTNRQRADIDDVSEARLRAAQRESEDTSRTEPRID